jgi:hypothetical protein
MRLVRLGPRGREVPAVVVQGVHHDLINTGTSAGVALGLPDAPYLRAGDVVELEITGLGRACQKFEQA